MHHPLSSPLPSRSFDYKVYDTKPFETTDTLHDVVIVGGGVIGLHTALELALYGVKVVVITQERQVCYGSRAIVLIRRSQEILQQAGVFQRFVDKGYFWNKGKSFYKGQLVYNMVIPHDENERYLPALNLQQPYIEQFLIEECEKTKNVEFRFGQKLIDISQGNTATLTLDTEFGEYKLNSKWVIAADGGRSFIRKALGLRMEGKAYAGNFVIVDIEADLPLPTERLCYFSPDWNEGNNVLIHRQPDNLWRLDYRLPDGETAEEALAEEKLHERIKLILKMINHDVDYKVDWATVYSASTLTLPDYRCNRTFFVGDAAHLLPIFGVRGANTGFMDANNLAWKLAAVIKGEASEKLLDSYSKERVPAAREIIEESGKSTRFMTPPTNGFKLMRDAVLELSLSQDFIRDLLHWRTSKPQNYTHSALNSLSDEVENAPPLGSPFANFKLGDDDYALDHIKGQHGFKTIIIGKTLAAYFNMPKGSCLLLRPDNHIAGVFASYDKTRVKDAIKFILGGGNAE